MEVAVGPPPHKGGQHPPGGEAAAHLKTTVVRQAARSAYREVEVNVGARLARHDVRVEQLGPATETELQCFSLAGPGGPSRPLPTRSRNGLASRTPPPGGGDNGRGGVRLHFSQGFVSQVGGHFLGHFNMGLGSVFLAQIVHGRGC